MSQDTRELTADVGTAAIAPDDVAEITQSPNDVLAILDTYLRDEVRGVKYDFLELEAGRYEVARDIEKLMAKTAHKRKQDMDQTCLLQDDRIIEDVCQKIGPRSQQLIDHQATVAMRQINDLIETSLYGATFRRLAYENEEEPRINPLHTNVEEVRKSRLWGERVRLFLNKDLLDQMGEKHSAPFRTISQLVMSAGSPFTAVSSVGQTWGIK